MTLWVPDNSSLQRFRQNPELFRLRHRLHLVPKSTLEVQAKDAGSAFHAGLNVWFGEPTSNGDAALLALRLAWPAILEELPQLRPATVESRLLRPVKATSLADYESLLADYCVKWPRESDPFVVDQTEQYVQERIRAGGAEFDWSAIVDRVIRFPDGSRYPMDTKTTGLWVGPEYWRTTSVSDQMVGQVALEHAGGRRADGFMIDLVATRGKRDFTRYGPVAVPDWRIERWARDVRWTLDEIARLEDERGIDKPWPCYHNWNYGKTDEYWPFIEQPDELHAELRAQFVEDPWVPKEVASNRSQKPSDG